MYDQDTIDRLIQGDDDAFSTIYDELSPTVYHRVYDRLQDHAKAREALRNIFLDVYRHSSQLRDAMLFDQWIESLIKFYTSPQATNDVRNENPDLQIVWADISETIASEVKNDEVEPMKEETNEEPNQEMTQEGSELAWEIQETLEDPYDFAEQVIVYDDSLDTDLMMEQAQTEEEVDKEIIEQKDDIDDIEADDSMPGVDAEVAKLIEELRTEDWSPILFPPDDVDDMPKNEMELPWMRSIEVENYDFNIDPSVLEVANALISEEASINVNPMLDTDEEASKGNYDDTMDLLSDSSVEIVTEIEGMGDQLKNISFFPSSSKLMDRSNAERTDPPEWLTAGILPNIDSITASASPEVIGDVIEGEQKESTIMGSVVLKDDKIPLVEEISEESADYAEKTDNTLAQEVAVDVEDVTESSDEQEIANDAIEEVVVERNSSRPIRTFTKGHMKSKQKTKLAAVYYESVNIDVDQVNSRISYERVPYEYVPYEEASQAVYDQFNDDKERRRTQRMEPKKEEEKKKERIFEPEKTDQSIIDFGKVEMPKAPEKAKKPKKSFAAAGLFIAVIVVIGGAIYFAKISGLI